jgi:hypothetical protein
MEEPYMTLDVSPYRALEKNEEKKRLVGEWNGGSSFQPLQTLSTGSGLPDRAVVSSP